ncbi:MAG: site-specific integrase, partial [Sphingobacteriales bacterium]
MATSYKIIARKDRTNGKGEMPLYIRITENRKSSYKALGIYVPLDMWDEERQMVNRRYPNSARVNNFLNTEIGKVQGKALEMATSDQIITAKRIKEAVIRKVSSSFSDYYQKHLKNLVSEGKPATYAKSVAVYSKLNIFVEGRNLSFADIDANFLQSYERYLREGLGNSINTIHANLKIFRMLFNKAVYEDLILANNNPFVRFKLRTEKTTKNFVTDDELALLEALDIPIHYVLNHHRWMYIFACYAGGLRISDILQLRWRNFNGSHLLVTMHKTRDIVSVKLPGKALAILEEYQKLTAGRSENFIFPILNSQTDYAEPMVLFRAISSATAYTNKNLKILAAKAGIDKSFSFHTSRHTFATRAL